MTAQPIEKPINKFEILRLWRCGYDTSVIAKRMRRNECEVANALAEIRDLERQQ